MKTRWRWLVAGACVFQLTNCAGTASETVVRIGFDLIFLPLNGLLGSLFGLS